MTTTITTLELERLLKKVLKKYITSKRVIKQIVDYTFTTERMGISTHGVEFVLQILHKLESKVINTSSNQLITKASGFHLFNANNNIGIISAYEAMDIAIKNANKKGVHTVFVRGANTFGAASYYTYQATKKGMIGILFSNAPAAMRIPDTTKNMLGTNPISIAIPSSDGIPILLDMASSIVAKSKLREFANSNTPVPDGWGTDAYGNITNDAMKIIDGSIAPFGGYKGMSIALMIDILSGLLSGSSYLDLVGRWNSSNEMNIGQTIIVINPELIFNGFLSVVQNYKEYINQNADVTAVHIPGTSTMINYHKNVQEIIITSETIEKLKAYL